MNKLVIKYYLLALRNEKKSKLSKKDKKEIINQHINNKIILFLSHISPHLIKN